MNATNLGWMPSDRQLFAKDHLQHAAIKYGEISAAIKSAVSCGLPECFTGNLSEHFIQAKSELELAALEYFDNVYDGAKE